MTSTRLPTTNGRAARPLAQLRAHGQALWLEYLRRDLLLQGALRTAIDRDQVRGVSSTPTTFAQAIAWTGQYDVALAEWVRRGEVDATRLYERLAFADIEVAADQLRDVYERGDRRDGFVSLPLPPTMAHDRVALIAEAQRIAAEIGRPNVMLTVYATPAGLEALTQMVAAGLNTNVAAVCGLQSYGEVAEAYFRGLEQREGDLGGLGAVASLPIGTIDQVTDQRLSTVGSGHGAAAFAGQAAIAIARLAYRDWKRLHSGPRWTRLAARGARPQRLLFSALSTPEGRAGLRYAEALIGADSVSAMPVATLDEFRARGRVEPTLESGLAEAEATLMALDRMGLDPLTTAAAATAAEVARFTADYSTLLGGIERKRTEVLEGLPPLNPPRSEDR